MNITEQTDISTSSASVQTASLSEQHSIIKSSILHLFPGVLIFLFYLVTVPLARKSGYPSGLALLVAIPVVLIPFELGFLLREGKKRNGRLSLKGIVLYTEPMPRWQYIVLGFLLFSWLGLAFGVLADPIDNFIIDHFFAWVPDWFFLFGRTVQLTQYTKTVLLVTAIINVLFNGLAGPIVEELYFRGYLLPRLSRLKGWAPCINILLFSLYHFFTPWQNATRIIGLFPLVYTVWGKKNIFLGMIVHCAGNLVGAVGMLVMALSL